MTRTDGPSLDVVCPGVHEGLRVCEGVRFCLVRQYQSDGTERICRICPCQRRVVEIGLSEWRFCSNYSQHEQGLLEGIGSSEKEMKTGNRHAAFSWLDTNRHAAWPIRVHLER